MLVVRTVIAVAMVVLGAIVLARMIVILPAGRFGIIPGLVLGAAMIALGLHRLKLIARVRGMQ